jgi:uncharacterized membrane protein
MMTEYLRHGLEIITAILAGITLISAFFFNRKGLGTRKTIIITFLCFLLFAISAWLTGVLYNPSAAFTAVPCLGGFIIVVGLFWAIKYFSLPYIEKRVDKITKKED